MSWTQRLAAMTPLCLGLGLCLVPHVSRLKSPSLYADDIVRVAQLQTEPLGELILAPFNEHLAPLFQLVSWLSWRLAGRTLAHAPLAFTLASFVPFVLTLGLLGRVVRRQSRSDAAALAGMAVFSLSWLAVETVSWYSASSFMWSLLFTLVAWSAAEPAASDRQWPRWLVALLASAAAPAFSMIGILAGPVAAVRGLTATGPRARAAALAPLTGMLLFLAAYGVGHSRGLVSTSADQTSRIVPGLVAASRAPAASLVPAVFGLRTLPASGRSGVILSAATLACAAGLLIRAWRVSEGRAFTIGGLVLIAGGYSLTFCARAGGTVGALLETQRYHLFPILGLVFLLTPWLRRGFERWSDDPARAVWVALAITAALLVVHQNEMQGRARFLRFPDQRGTLAALDRLGAICLERGVTREQAIAALDPVETAWTPQGYSLFVMLRPGAKTSKVPDRLVKSTLLAGLTASERRSVCGGMDATPYLRPGPPDHSVNQPAARFRIHDDGAGGLVSAGWPSFLEYAMDGSEKATALSLTVSPANEGLVEVWWRGERGRWSETRSVRLRPSEGGTWMLPLDKLPHWNPAEARRVRLLFHDAGPVSPVDPRWVD